MSYLREMLRDVEDGRVKEIIKLMLDEMDGYREPLQTAKDLKVTLLPTVGAAPDQTITQYMAVSLKKGLAYRAKPQESLKPNGVVTDKDELGNLRVATAGHVWLYIANPNDVNEGDEVWLSTGGAIGFGGATPPPFTASGFRVAMGWLIEKNGALGKINLNIRTQRGV